MIISTVTKQVNLTIFIYFYGSTDENSIKYIWITALNVSFICTV